MHPEFHRGYRLIPVHGSVLMHGNIAAGLQNSMHWHAKVFIFNPIAWLCLRRPEGDHKHSSCKSFFFPPKVHWLLSFSSFIFPEYILTEFIKYQQELSSAAGSIRGLVVSPILGCSLAGPPLLNITSSSKWPGCLCSVLGSIYSLTSPICPKDSRKEITFKSKFSLEDSSKEVLSYSELLSHCCFGLLWVSPANASSVSCHTSRQKWTHTMCFVSHGIPHF